MRICCLYPGPVPQATWNSEFLREIRQLGNLELHGDVALWEPEKVLATIRRSDVLLTGHGTLAVPSGLLRDRGRLACICHMAGTIRSQIPRAFIEAGIPVTNWGDAPAQTVAEGAMALLLAVLKEIPAHILDKRDGKWVPDSIHRVGSLKHLPVGLFGLGVIGQRFVEMIRPFRPRLLAFDPYQQNWPDDIERMESLAELCGRSFVLVLHAGLSDETRHAIGADLLARLPDGAILINTARGGLVDHDALFRELESGRLRAGLDVLDVNGKDWLPPGHPAVHWPNVILTSHRVGHGSWPSVEQLPERALSARHLVCIDNLKRFATGEPLRFTFDLARYDRST